MSTPIPPSQLASYLDLFHRTLDGFFLLHQDDLSVRDVNPAAEQLLGSPAEELLGKNFLDWIIPDERDHLLQSWRIAKRRYHSRQIASVIQLPQGKQVRVDLTLGSLQLQDGTEILQIIAQDRTQVYEANQKVEKAMAEMAELNRRLEALAVTDEMTQLPNFRQFQSRLNEVHQTSDRYGRPYSLLFCDLDNFKHYNDRNGHPAGDVLLRELAKILIGCSREVDLVARYGGEEFVILCPETPCKGALIMAERIRVAVEQHPFPHADAQPLGKVTFSIGVAGFPENGQDAAKVLKAADEAVYAAKHAGRNQVKASEKRVTPS